ncbi:MAG: hypothetical protein R3F34_20365 [Planctomycetota bacterium]
MNRTTFLTLSSLVAFAVAAFALAAPDALLSSKGVTHGPAATVWVREVGALIFASGVTTFLSRRSVDSHALRALLVGNAALHAVLFPIELSAFAGGVITKVGGVAPNSVLHVVLAVGFALLARRVVVSDATEPSTARGARG